MGGERRREGKGGKEDVLSKGGRRRFSFFFFSGESHTSFHQPKVLIRITQSKTKYKNALKRRLHGDVSAEPPFRAADARGA